VILLGLFICCPALAAGENYRYWVKAAFVLPYTRNTRIVISDRFFKNSVIPPISSAPALRHIALTALLILFQEGEDACWVMSVDSPCGGEPIQCITEGVDVENAGQLALHRLNILTMC